MNDAFVLVLITVPSLEIGNRIAQQLLLEKRVACVNILPNIHSLYWWEGKIEAAEEFLLICKTSSERFSDEFYQCVRSSHPYDVPEMISVPILGGYPPYLDWMKSVIG
jgi:periplasmic divalent cation tolerance protein